MSASATLHPSPSGHDSKPWEPVVGEPVKLVAPQAAPAKALPGRGWLLSPVWDLLLVANVAWPALAILAWSNLPAITAPLTFAQIYFISSPHRWITLALVLLDRNHFASRKLAFAGVTLGLLGLGVALILVGPYWPGATHSLALFMMVDYVWNAWHFAAQHAGISRIYGRATRPDQTPADHAFEKGAIRAFVLWTFLRVAVHTGSTQGGPIPALPPELAGWLSLMDPCLLLLPLALIGRECKAGVTSRLAYLISMTAVYAAQLVAITMRDERWLAALFLAGAVFHAVEYLAIVGWSVRRKTGGAWDWIVPRLLLTIVAFALVIGVFNSAFHHWSAYGWGVVTLMVSLLHYAYDGMIWKAPRPKPAA
jgi:hypothetical protein